MRNRDFDIEQYAAKEQSDGSYVDKDGCITWYNEEGEWHREDGPAIINNDGDVEWMINGNEYKFADWLFKLNKTDEEKMMLRLQYA
jgi:hypothetical protein